MSRHPPSAPPRFSPGLSPRLQPPASPTAAGPTAAAAPAGQRWFHGAAATANRDGGQQFHGVVVALWALAGIGGLRHGPGTLERRTARAAAVLITWHVSSIASGRRLSALQ